MGIKIWNVRWSPPSDSLVGLMSMAPAERVRAFGSKAKAEEFYGELIKASQLIGIAIKSKVEEVELES